SRYCAHMTQRLVSLPISTRRVAMCMRHVLTPIVYAIVRAPRTLSAAIMNAIDFLATNARRAHPAREAKSGRLKLGLQHVYGTP
ncbi:MAG: hypothetical protein AB7Q97_13160, partial [Gammaproteobacteria bacterium]